VSALVATHLAASAAALTWVLLEWAAYRRPTALGLLTGAVAGLVAVTPASGFVGPVPALVIGMIVAPLSFYAIRMKDRFRYDDALDVFGVHCVGGIWGALATGLFAAVSVNPACANGLLMGGGPALLVKQLAGVGVALLVAAVATPVIALTLKATAGLRVSVEEEDSGLDLSEHGESAYAGAATGSEDTVITGAAAAAPVEA
jgi:Amt family ammonium transporter